MASKISFNPTVAKFTMFGLIALIIGSGFGLYVLGRNLISENAAGVAETVAELKRHQDEFNRIDSLRSQMKEIEDIKPIIEEISANNQDNRYQEKIIQTFNDYASRSGLTIASISFQIDAKTAAASKQAIISNISFDGEIDYNNLLKFIKYTEIGLPRMQIINLTINKITNTEKGGPNHVNSSIIQIKVYSK